MRLIELKYRWQVSLAALLMRAKKLGRITDGAYLTAIKFAAARGWRRTEPAPLGPPETPTMIAQLLTGPYAVEITAELPRRTLSEIVAATGSGQVIV